jgi:hypothetical protein
VTPERGAAARLTLRRGTLRLPHGVYERYFAGCTSVVLLPREGRLLLLPVTVGGGGSLLKVVNAQGDRAVAAAEVLRELGLDEDLLEGDGQAAFEAYWSPEHAGLVVESLSAGGPA